jgi:PAS domain S-box-containing protein
MAYKASIRDKLIGIFVLIKVIPLVVLAWFAWTEISTLSVTLENHVNEMAQTSTRTTKQVAGTATNSSIRALDVRSREAIERLTTDTARHLAVFLKARDTDIRTAALLLPGKAAYQSFVQTRNREVVYHHDWVMNDQGDAWVPAAPDSPRGSQITARNRDNVLDFHYRPPDRNGIVKSIPLYLEMSYLDLEGNEIVKVTTSDRLPAALTNVADRQQTYCRAETYFEELKTLSPGQIYVSEVIGAYVRTHMIGPYTRQRAQKMGISFDPEASGYAGKENPVGRRFQGLIRWAMPVVQDSRISGYVTLALDHTHIMEFTDHIIPTEERYSPISDAASGNYAFLWDYRGRNISHPRDYFIVGYDPQTGEPAMPWLEEAHYKQYETGDMTVSAFLDSLQTYDDQALSKPSSKDLIKQGLVGLDCRFLNFAPQCDGWKNLTQQGGSGSFVIHWSGLKKLTTAATVPYYTGRYGREKRGFGFVTIGANVDEFHKPAIKTAQELKQAEDRYVETIENQNRANKAVIVASMQRTATRLTVYTAIMVILVIGIAVMMASALTGKITAMIRGISRFQKGEMGYRLDIRTSDEIAALGKTFNSMADSVQTAMKELQRSKLHAEDSNISLRALLSRIIDSMPSIIIGVDTQARVTLWNNEAVQMTGKSFEQVENKSIREVFPLLRTHQDLLRPAIETGRIEKAERVEMKSGRDSSFYDITVYPLISDTIDGAVVRVDNATTRVYMEEMMIQTEKMQSIGGLAAGMAHEINSPLAGIIQSAQVIQNRVKPGLNANVEAARQTGVHLEDMNRYLEKRSIFKMLSAILDAGHRAADIVAGMLAFSRKSDSAFSLNQVEKLLDQTLEIVKKDYDIKKQVDFENIEIEKSYDPDLPEIPCDVGKIQQVFFNILKNGAHAMMETSHDRHPLFKVSTQLSGKFAQIDIEDNGPGMDEETRSRIFEPFFTTKNVGIGTGLGLYISYFIVVENHKGAINVHSVPGRGSRFTIRLPLAR